MTSAARFQLEPVLDFMRLLWSVEHGLQRMSKRMESELGITGPQRLVLRVVGQFPGLSAGELAHIVRLHPSTITGILQRLVARGLLERERDPSDSRRARLRLKPRAVAYTQVVSRNGGEGGDPGARSEPAHRTCARPVRCLPKSLSDSTRCDD